MKVVVIRRSPVILYLLFVDQGDSPYKVKIRGGCNNRVETPGMTKITGEKQNDGLRGFALIRMDCFNVEYLIFIPKKEGRRGEK